MANSSSAPTPSTDYYELLGLARDASKDDIQAAYRKAAKRFHPDRHAAKSAEEQAAAAEQFKLAAEAHAVLSDDKKRQLYDAYGHAGLGAGASDDAAAQSMFEQMFGMGGGGEPPKKRRLVGGALFVDPTRGDFFQRSWDPLFVDKMRKEMTEGLPAVESAGAAADYTITTSLPHGAWEVRFVEATGGGELSVSLCAAGGETAGEPDEPLRLERTFTLPEGADAALAEVSVDEAGVLSVTAPSAEAGAAPADDTAKSDAEMRAAAGIDVDAVEAAWSAAAAEMAAADAPAPSYGFAVGEEPKAATPPKGMNRAARQRATKQGGLKAGFLNGGSKQKRRTAAKENDAINDLGTEGVVKEMVNEGHGTGSPVSVREKALNEAVRGQLDELMQGA